MGSSPQTELQAEGARSTDDVTWGNHREILHNGSYYASIPPWIILNLGLNDEGAEYQAGYTPAGQDIIIEEEAIIIRRSTEASHK